ncbi:hypothetical protein BJP40_24480 [Streptomyces sp. CC53]|uniref:nucleotide disphospho-sugar-binding domain-containing protein n=1 Tax=unclassified Streptomyces TaxID=2593676 RepID=UPI0008DD568C|nr:MULTISPECIES: nucleotide disphospho-sugar-binding domain-containing protein [unclassified Streptomyces]OII63364.1 hypothetical protein BJP40_24480 [Streptomyces sp. CC53]
MRVLFTIFPASAHLYPAIPLAWALRSAGHEVVVACPDGVVDRKVVDAITAAGLTALPLGGREELTASLAPLLAAAGPDRPTLALDPDDPDAWRTARAVLGRMLHAYYPPETAEGGRRPVLDALVEFAAAWRPDLVLWDPLAPTGAVAARTSGAAHARLLFGSDNVGLIRARTREELADPASGLTEDPWMPWLRPVLERYGLDFTEETLTGQWTLDLTPPRMRTTPLDLTYVPVRRVPYGGAAALPDWLRARPERPRAVLTLGVSRRLLAGRHSGFPMREFFASVSGLDLELVATLNSEQLEAAGPLPGNVRALPYLPLDQVLPTSSAIIHHGGGGTFAAAVAFTVPQLVVPLPMWDEAVTARYVARRGAGLVADPAQVDADSLQKDLLRLIEEPSFRLGARALHDDMLAAPAPADVVPVLERLTAEHRG